MYDEANLRSLRRRARGAVGECPVWPQTTYTLDGATTNVQDDQMGEIGYWVIGPNHVTFTQFPAPGLCGFGSILTLVDSMMLLGRV